MRRASSACRQGRRTGRRRSRPAGNCWWRMSRGKEVLRGEAAVLEKRISRLQEEYESLPEDTDMREAWKMLSGSQEDSGAHAGQKGARLERELMEVGEALGELKRQAAEIAQKLYLTCSYETFRRAEEAASDYRQHFYQLRSGHELFLQIRAHIEELGERQEILDGEMDQIRYEAGQRRTGA